MKPGQRQIQKKQIPEMEINRSDFKSDNFKVILLGEEARTL